MGSNGKLRPDQCHNQFLGVKYDIGEFGSFYVPPSSSQIFILPQFPHKHALAAWLWL